MAIKVDLEKAYDRLRWAFFEETLEVTGIPEKLRKVIMHCITSSSMRLIWNGQTTEEFLPTKGIRQGESTFSIYFCPFYEEIISFDICGSS